MNGDHGAPTLLAANEAYGSVARWLGLLERLWAAARSARAGLDGRLRGLGLSDAEIAVLWICRQAEPGGAAQGELGQRLGLSPAALSALVERLRRRGLIVSERPTGDRRRQLWRLGEAGEKALADAFSAVAEWVARLDEQLPPAEASWLDLTLRELSRQFVADAPDGAASARPPGPLTKDSSASSPSRRGAA